MAEQKSKLVRISDDTMKKLKKNGKAFETPNDCINRLLSKNPCKSVPTEKDEDIEEEDEDE